ncbi:MAG TPA: alcohol dehydrogenase catalytic domain-containing protein [Paenibacillus sp.]|nr:alcohol dehydrogenase catalytic domain-containing protein [Paenibacillus sp.]
MEALVWNEEGTIVRRTDVSEPSPAPNQVKVQVMAEGVCMTDIEMVRGRLKFAKPPWILGHEMAGIVTEAGALASEWKPGDRVVVDPVVTCGSCRYCATGKKYLCAGGGELGTTYGSGGYGQYVLVPASNLYRLPDAMSFEEGAMMEPLNCTLGAIHRVPDLVGKRALVFGPGPAGLLFVQLAKLYGAASVTLAGTRDEKLLLGAALGADRTVNVRAGGEANALEDEAFDVVIEASGSLDAVRDAFRCVDRSGTVVLYGLNGSEAPSIVSDRVIGKDLTIVTCISAPLLWQKGIDLAASGRIRLKDIVTLRVPFEEAESVLNAIVRGENKTTKAMMYRE